MNIIHVEASGNAKTGLTSATYAPQSTCPPTCPFKGNGCYAERGNMNIHTARINKKARGVSILALAREEADAINKGSIRLDMRVHVVGDCATPSAAKLVGGAMADRDKRAAGPVAWTYTHAWRTVPKTAWQGARVMASVEDPKDVPRAHAKGYAVACVVPSFDGPALPDGFQGIPCLYQTRGIQCVDCRLCLEPDRLHAKKRVILFAPERNTRATVLRVLP